MLIEGGALVRAEPLGEWIYADRGFGDGYGYTYSPVEVILKVLLGLWLMDRHLASWLCYGWMVAVVIAGLWL